MTFSKIKNMLNNFFNKHEKSITISVTVLIIVAFFIYFKPLLNFMSVNSESFFSPYMSKIEFVDNDSLWQIFTSNNHSWFLFSAVYVILARYLPIWLNLHPQTCIAYVSSYIFFLIFICLILALTKSCTKYIENKKLFPFVFLLCCFAIFPMLVKADFMWLFKNDCWFLAYVFLPVFGILLNDKIQKKYVLSEKYSKKDLLITGILILCVAFSHEFYRFTFLLTIFFVFLFSKEYKNRNLKQNITFIISYIGLILLNLLTFLTKVHRQLFSEKTTSFCITEFFNQVQMFWEYYKIYVLKDNMWLLLVLVTTILLISERKNKRFVIWTISSILSILIFAFSLIIVQDDYKYWDSVLYHQGLRFLIKITLYSALMSSIGYFIAFNNYKNKTAKVLISVSLLLSAFVFDITPYTYNLNGEITHSKTVRKNAYVLEKIFAINKTNTFYNYFDLGVFTNIAPFYLNKVYGRTLNPHKYKVYNVCKKNTADLNVCRERLMKIAEEKFGCTFTDEELEKLDFESLRK